MSATGLQCPEATLLPSSPTWREPKTSSPRSAPHQHPAKPAGHARDGEVPPGCSTDPAAWGKLGWLALAPKHCWCWMNREFLILCRSSRLDTPVGGLVEARVLSRVLQRCFFGKNVLRLNSLQIIWLRRHLLCWTVLLSPFPSVLLAFSAKKKQQFNRSPSSEVTIFRCSRLPLTLWQPHTSRIPAGWCRSSVRDACSYREKKTHIYA